LRVQFLCACRRQPVVFAILQVAELGARRELAVMLICDSGARERRLQAQRVCPRILGTPDSATLANVEQQLHISVAQHPEKGSGIEAIHADGRAGTHHFPRARVRSSEARAAAHARPSR
jgi:hypothetical protein